MSRAAVIGGGISGIATAYYLQQYGLDVHLYESNSQLGGRIGSECIDGRWLDFGGKNIGRKYRRFREFVADLGEQDFEYFGFNTSQVIRGRVVRLNKEKARLYNLFRVLTLAGPVGILKLIPLIRAVHRDREQGFLNTPYFNAIADRFDHESLASFFPKSCAGHIIRPVTVRMNGAEPEECYPGNFGSNLALVLDSYEQLRCGMQGMLERFQAYVRSVTLFTGHHVQALECRNGKTVLHYTCGAESFQKEYSKVVVALPAVQAAELFRHSAPELSALLGQVQYYPVAVAIARYREEVFTDVQRAMVFDRSSPLSNAGAYGIRDLDIVRYTFSGKTARSMITRESDPDEVVSLGEKIVKPYFNIEKNSRTSFTYKYIWPGLCAYSPHHYRRLEKLDELIKPLKGLSLTGDYRRGASLEACFRAAAEAADLVKGGGLRGCSRIHKELCAGRDPDITV